MDKGCVVNLRSLRYFAEIVRLNGITAAAESLRIAQPAVSRQIQNLEKELGVKLFERSRKGIELTGAGEFLHKRVVPLILELDQTKHLLTEQAKADVTDVVIGLTAGEGATVAPILIDAWSQRFPAAKIRIVEALAPTIYDQLKSGALDFCIVTDPMRFPDIWTKPLFEEPIVLIAPTEDAGGVLPFQDLEDLNLRKALSLPLVLPSRPNPLRTTIEDIAAAHGITIDVTYELDSMSIIKDLVSRGNAYGFTTYSYLSNEADMQKLRVFELPDAAFKRHISMMGLFDGPTNPSDSAVIEFIEGRIIQTVADGQWPGAKPI